MFRQLPLYVMLAAISFGAQASASKVDAAGTITVTASENGRAHRERFTDPAQATLAATRLRTAHPQSGLSIVLSSGTYRIAQPIQLTPALSGTSQAPTTIVAAPGATVVLSGSPVLVAHWKPYKNGIYVTDAVLPPTDQLWINGQRQIRARYPNYDPKAILGGYSADALSPERIARWSDPAGGEIHAIHAARWGSVFWTIESKTPDGKLILGKPAGNNRVADPDMGGPNPTQRYVENIFEELDSPGEWFYNVSQHKLYYMPTPGLDLDHAQVETTALEQLLVVSADKDHPVHDIRVEGITFTHTARTATKAFETLLRSDWAIYRSGVVTLEGAVDVTIADCNFIDVGGNAVFVSGYNRGVSITGNLIRDVGGSGVSFVGRHDAVRSPADQYRVTLPFAEIDRTPGPKSDNYPADSSAIDNLITQIGVTDKQGAGVAIDIAKDITIGHNSIYDLPRAGINVGDGNFGGHIIENNDVFQTVLQTGDHGSYNSWGRDRYWESDVEDLRRRVAANPTMPFLDVLKPIILRNNRWRCDDGFDIDLDDGSSNYEIYNNVLLHGGLKEREGFSRIVTNNIIINNGLHPHVSFKNSGDVFRHNIVMGPYQPIFVDQWDFDFDDNLFTTFTILKEAQKLGADKHSLAGDPDFVDPAHGDYQVTPNSPALKIGFKNFPMDFGVTSPRLKAMAKTPVFPELLTMPVPVPGKTYDFSGATIKSLETLGEQSATGAPDRRGALVLSVQPGSKAADAGLRRGDLIRMVDLPGGSSFPITDAPTLLVLRASHKWVGQLEIEVLRQGKILKLHVAY